MPYPPQQENGQREPLIAYSIYRWPTDYPDKFVVRRFEVWPSDGGGVVPDDRPVGVVDGLAEARGLIPVGLHRMPREPADAVSVVETWL